MTAWEGTLGGTRCLFEPKQQHYARGEREAAESYRLELESLQLTLVSPVFS